MLDRILCCDDQKRLRQLVGMRIHGDLPFIHRFKQRGLSLRRGAVDLIRKQNVGEHRAAFEFESLIGNGIYRNTNDVGRQHVAGELDALKAAA